ncbi:MAG: PAS domain S-box protein, partial [Nitrospirae bacterium]|nr:PAS domain S-box protein [Nitrospirota bacterium]
FWRKDGTSFPVAYTSTPIIEQGEVAGAVVTFLDITARKKAEDDLKVSEENFRRLVDRNPVAMTVADKSGKFIYFNSRFKETFGYTLEDIPTVDDWWPLAYPDEEYRQKVIDGWRAAARKAIKNKDQTESREWRVRCRDGSSRDIEFKMASLQDVNIVIFNDITERKQAEEALKKAQAELERRVEERTAELSAANAALQTEISERKLAEESLRESEERLSLALKAAGQSIYDLDLKTGQGIVSREYALMLGYDPAEFHETTAKWIKRLHPDDKKHEAAVYSAYVKGEIPEYKVEARQMTKDGNWKWILSLGKIIERDAEGNPLRMIGTHTDITERKRAEAERVHLALEAQALELELLKYREKYHIVQQESAFKKELNIIRDDLFLKKVDVVNSRGAAVEWAIHLYYKPLDILSGDSYSILEIGEGKVLVYLADAMGKGLAASVTSIISTSFVNHLVNEAKEGTGFDFGEFIAAYSRFIRKGLIEEEILCMTIIFLDLVNETMETAICGMPPVFCHAADDTIVKIENNNPPLMMYPAEMRIDRYDISGFHKMLAHTDGLNESFRNEDSLYQEYLEEDFRQSEFSNQLAGRFNKAIQKPDDDVTFIFLRRIDRNPKWTKVITIASRMEELAAVATEVEEFLETLDADTEFKVMFINAFNEMLMNAYEHGSLNIDLEQKGRLVRDDTYQDYLLDAEKGLTKKIDITLSLQELNGEEYLMLTVTDEGKGFDTSPLRAWSPDFSSLNGRGIQMVLCSSDELFYNRAGNEVTLLKRLSTSVHK